MVSEGAQMATKTIDEGIRCAEMAAEAGASWIDLNCGCEFNFRALGFDGNQLEFPGTWFLWLSAQL